MENDLRKNPIITSLIKWINDVKPADIDKASSVNLDLIRFALETDKDNLIVTGRDLAQKLYAHKRNEFTTENILKEMMIERPDLAVTIKSNRRNYIWFSNQIKRFQIWIFDLD